MKALVTRISLFHSAGVARTDGYTRTIRVRHDVVQAAQSVQPSYCPLTLGPLLEAPDHRFQGTGMAYEFQGGLQHALGRHAAMGRHRPRSRHLPHAPSWASRNNSSTAHYVHSRVQQGCQFTGSSAAVLAAG